LLIDHSVEANHAALNVLGMLRPKRLLGAQKIRVGRSFDGGYVMIDMFEGIDAAYSLGINDDVSWDLDIVKYGIPIFQYDPTIPNLPQEHKLFNWEPVWIGGAEDQISNTQSLENLIQKNGHSVSKDLLLKCDIEGSEWPMLQQTPNAVFAQFRQMVFEIHDLKFIAQNEHLENVRNAIFNLTASHNLVHVHGNNYGGWTIVGGIPLPNVIEATFIRKDVGEFVDSDEIFPTNLDMPCKKDMCDMFIGSFCFQK